MTAKKKHAGGRPRLYKKTEVEKFQDKIDEYFVFCDAKIKTVESEKLGTLTLPDPEPYTMSGLAYWLGMDRRSLLNYADTKEFFPAIKRARSKVEADVERRMNDKATFTPGLIFNAKNNFDWKDKTETDITSKGESVVGFTILPPTEKEDE